MRQRLAIAGIVSLVWAFPAATQPAPQLESVLNALTFRNIGVFRTAAWASVDLKALRRRNWRADSSPLIHAPELGDSSCPAC
jgi:hypothetical protein